MSKKVTFKEVDGLEIVWLNNKSEVNKIESSDINKYGGSRPKNNLEKDFNNFFLRSLWRCWTIFSIDHWPFNSVGTYNNFEKSLEKYLHLTKQTVESELMKIFNAFSLGRHYVLNYRSSIKISNILNYRGVTKNILPIMRIWYIRIYKNKEFCATRIQTFIRMKFKKYHFKIIIKTNIIIKWWKNLSYCKPFKNQLQQEIIKRDKWIDLYVDTIPKYKNKIALKLKCIRNVLLTQYKNIRQINKNMISYKKLLKEKELEIASLEEGLLEFEKKNWELLKENALLNTKLKNLKIEIPKNDDISLKILSPPVNIQIVKVRANELINKLNAMDISSCTLGKDFTVRVNTNIVIVCSGRSKIYTILSVEDGCQDNWKNASIELFRANTLDDTITQTIKHI
jgi:hypothetical protein